MNSQQVYAQFREKVEQNPELYFQDYKEIKNIVDNSSAIYDGEPVQFLYQPVFYTSQEISTLKKICAQLRKILIKVINHYRKDAKFRSYFGFPSIMEELILQDPGYNFEFPMARFDLFIGPRGAKFCELNADGTSGMNEARVIQNCFQESAIISRLEKNYDCQTFELFFSWIDALEENYRQWGGDPGENPGLAIVDFSSEGVETEFEEFNKRFRQRGYQSFICDPRELEYREGNLFLGTEKIDIIYRRATTSRLIEERESITDLLTAYREGNVCLVGGFVSQIIHNKIIFALLGDEEKVDFLTSSEKKFISRYIPRTEIFHYDNKDQREKVINNKNRYILKPSDWFACHGVYAGLDYSPADWEEVVQNTTSREYIVQEFYSPPQKEMLTFSGTGSLFWQKFNLLTGVYLYNHQFQGIYNRAGRKNIIGAGGETFTLPAFVLNEKEE